MRSRILGAASAALAAMAGVVVLATPASAGATCETATPMGAGYEMGTVSRNGSVGALDGTTDDWWEHSTYLDGGTGRSISMATPGAGGATMTVYGSDCTRVLCTATASPATCATPLPDGLVKILVKYDLLSAGGATATAYTVTAIGGTPTECSDDLDNDGDGFKDFTIDPHCTSYADNTEAPVRIAAYGHLTITTDANNVPRFSKTGVYNDPAKFTCNESYSPYVQIVCNQVFDPEVVYDCTHFILTARAPSPVQSGTGNVRGHVGCASGSIETADVIGAGTGWADNTASGVTMGPALPVVCRALGVNGAALPSGSYQVDCYEPGVAWPFESSPL